MFSRGSKASLDAHFVGELRHQLHQPFGAGARHRVRMKRRLGLHHGVNQVRIHVVFRGGFLDDVVVGLVRGNRHVLGRHFDVGLRFGLRREAARRPGAPAGLTTSAAANTAVRMRRLRAPRADRSCLVAAPRRSPCLRSGPPRSPELFHCAGMCVLLQPDHGNAATDRMPRSPAVRATRAVTRETAARQRPRNASTGAEMSRSRALETDARACSRHGCLSLRSLGEGGRHVRLLSKSA